MTLRNLTQSSAARRASALRGRRLFVERLEARALLAGVAEMVEDAVAGGGISPDQGSYPINLANVDGTLYFSATDGTNGFELWRSAASGLAEIVLNAQGDVGIYPGAGDSYPQEFTNINGTLYFQATSGEDSTELWRINAAGRAEMVEDGVADGGIYPGPGSGYPQYLTNVSGTLYFRANDGTNGRELWRVNSNGQAEMVEDALAGGGINPGAGDPSVSYLTNVSGTLYFWANDGANGKELWRINASGRAEMVENALAGGGINPGSASSLSISPFLTNVNGTLYFRADDGANGKELWRINASGRAEMVEDAVPGGGINPSAASSSPLLLTSSNGTLYFQATDGTNGTELWRINTIGRAEMVEDSVAGGGINPGSANSGPRNLTSVGGTLYFSAGNSASGTELWRINASGKAEMIEDAVAGGGIAPGSAGSDPTYLTNVNGTLYFNATDGTNGYELWRINPSGKAELVEDAVPGGGIKPGSANSLPRYLTNINGALFFSASDSANGLELWRINASGQAEMVEDAVAGGGINPGSANSDPRDLTDVSGTLYFRAGDGTNGSELWRVRVPDPPVIGSFGGAVTYTENAPSPTRVATTATVTDSDSPNFVGGKLVARLTVNAQSTDRLSIVTLNSVSTSSNEVHFAGIKIGTFSGGAGTTALNIVFNAQATVGRVQAVLRNIAFRTISENPSASARRLAVFVTDGDGGTSATLTKNINVLPVNDPPLLDGISGNVVYTNAEPAVVLASAATVSDVDSANFNTGKLTVLVSDGAHASNRIELGGALFFINANNVVRKDAVNGNKVIGTLNANGGVGTTNFEVTFNGNATAAFVQQLVRALRFRTTNSASADDRVLSFRLTDGDGGTSATRTKTVNVS